MPDEPPIPPGDDELPAGLEPAGVFQASGSLGLESKLWASFTTVSQSS